jgi:glucokinase
LNTEQPVSHLQSNSTAVLAVDIGATNLRLCGCQYNITKKTIDVLWREEHISGSADFLHNTLIQAINKLQSTSNTDHVELATIGCPGIVSPDRRRTAITYLDPSQYINIADWLKVSGVKRTLLFNDVECGIFGIFATPFRQFHFLSGKLESGIPLSFMLAMPGTGLGISFWKAGTSWASEGGHGLIAISPHDSQEIQIWDGLHSVNPATFPVYDDVASGKGLAWLTRILSDQTKSVKSTIESLSNSELPEKLSAWAHGSEGNAKQKEFAQTIFRYFGIFLGRALQIPALTIMPEAMFLSGTIANANLSYFQKEFLTAFQSHRYHSKWLQSLPIALVKNLDLNMDGAIEAARRNLSSPLS